jgi:PHD/YefM family antitoxin component YafN of YafNO toxin-antitoxin module
MSILTMPVSDVRKTLNELLSTLDRPIFVTARGRVKAVLIDIDSYNALLDEMDDLRDERDPGLRQAMEQARGAYQRGETIALKDALKEDGL